MKLLMEVRVEDLPVSLLEDLPDRLATSAARLLGEARLEPGVLKAYATVRRLVLFLDRLPEKQADREIEVSGPPRRVAFHEDGTLTRAGEGYCRAHGIRPEELRSRKDGSRESVYYLKKEQGSRAADILPGLLARLLSELPCPLPMRWGREPTPFFRPVTGLLCLLDDCPLALSFAGRRARPSSRGHRSLAPASFPVPGIDRYFEEIARRHVILDPEKRLGELVARVEELAGPGVEYDRRALAGLSLGLESPACDLVGLELENIAYPEEIVASVIRNLRCLPLYRPGGALENRFVLVAEGRVTAEIKRGFRWVLENRLADAAFFWEEDLRLDLEGHARKLEQVVFQAGVGTMADYQRALVFLVRRLAEEVDLDGPDTEKLVSAAGSAKIDLTTSMVREFPEISGIYAARLMARAGFPEAVCRLAGEHYRPRFPGDEVPGEPLSCLLAFADKMLNLAGLFLSGAKITGNSDPYGLRRLAQGLSDLSWSGDLRVSLSGAVSAALAAWGRGQDEAVAGALNDFLVQRLEKILLGRRLRFDVAAAALAARGDSLSAVLKRARALEGFLSAPGGAAGLAAFVRVTNIIAQATEKGLEVGPVETALFRETAEKNFHDAWLEVKPVADGCLEAEDFAGALAALARLGGLVDRFFDEVLVMDPDTRLRANRLGLLAEIAEVLMRVGDIRLVRQEGAP